MAETNLLAMPSLPMIIETGTNEDWVDSIQFLVDIGTGLFDQLDLRGIAFEMEVRRAPPDHEVILTATTDDGTLAIGEPPDFGFLLINIGADSMKVRQPGDYVGDIVGTDDHSRRVIATFDLTIIQGITR